MPAPATARCGIISASMLCIIELAGTHVQQDLYTICLPIVALLVTTQFTNLLKDLVFESRAQQYQAAPKIVPCGQQVVGPLYAKYGEEMVGMLDGMFAFAVRTNYYQLPLVRRVE